MLTFRRHELQLRHRWAVSSNAASGGKAVYPVVFVELQDDAGRRGLGEAAPSSRYGETAETVMAFLRRIEARRLSFDDLPGSMAYLESIAPGNYPAKTAINVALLDGMARAARQPLCDFLGLGFTEGRHVTSFSIGIAAPEVIQQKVLAADPFPILKLKLGTPRDRENLAALREVAPRKTVRVDANEAWATKEEALAQMKWLAADGNIELVEQPMPAATPPRDWAWLRERSPLPFFADESFHHVADAARCADCFHGVNVKLVKTTGITGAVEALRAARQAGLKTMIGCMIESSLLISAAAHLAELADYLDLDGNLLITNDPFVGVQCERGVLSFAAAPEPWGVRARTVA